MQDPNGLIVLSSGQTRNSSTRRLFDIKEVTVTPFCDEELYDGLCVADRICVNEYMYSTSKALLFASRLEKLPLREHIYL